MVSPVHVAMAILGIGGVAVLSIVLLARRAPKTLEEIVPGKVTMGKVAGALHAQPPMPPSMMGAPNSPEWAYNYDCGCY